MVKKVLRLISAGSVIVLLTATCGNSSTPRDGSTAANVPDDGNAASAGDAIGLPSWDLILNERDLSDYGAAIDKEHSTDSDYETGGSLAIGTLGTAYRRTRSGHNFTSQAGKISIEIVVFKRSDYAKEEMDISSRSVTAQYVRKAPKGGRLRNYPYDPADTVEENKFLSEMIPLNETVGDQSFCYQWEGYSPRLMFRLENVAATIKVGSFGSEYLPMTLSVAKKQEAKLRRATGR